MGKSKYFTHVEPRLDEIRAMKANGKNNKQICRALGVDVSSFYLYQNKHPELYEIIKEGQKDMIPELEKSLYECAKGYMITETKTKTVTFEDGTKTVTEERAQRYIKPEVAALLFALSNLEPDKWQNRRNVNADVNGKTEVYIVDDIDEEDIE